MIAQYTQAGIVSELKRLAAPASADSIPSSAMQEDHVSMGWSAARKLRRALDGLSRVLAIEVLTAARGIDMRGPADTVAGHRRCRRAAAQSTSRGPARTGIWRPRSRPPSSLVQSGEVLAAAEGVVGPSCADLRTGSSGERGP